MAEKKVAKPDSGAEGLLAATARSVGRAAGELARSVGVKGEAPAKPERPRKSAKPRKAVRASSARAKQRLRAADVKTAAASAKPSPDDVRYRRIMGKSPSIWSAKDIDYVDKLVGTGTHS